MTRWEMVAASARRARDQLFDAQRDADARTSRSPYSKRRVDGSRRMRSRAVPRGRRAPPLPRHARLRGCDDRSQPAQSAGPRSDNLTTPVHRHQRVASDDPGLLGNLEQFFGVDQESFFVTPGAPKALDADDPHFVRRGDQGVGGRGFGHPPREARRKVRPSERNRVLRVATRTAGCARRRSMRSQSSCSMRRTKVARPWASCWRR